MVMVPNEAPRFKIVAFTANLVYVGATDKQLAQPIAEFYFELGEFADITINLN